MDLEHHQLDLRYERLRVRRPDKERQLLSSMSEHGQQAPIVVVAGASDGCYVVVDGHKRVRAARRLGQDTLRATVWPMEEAEALLLSRSLRAVEAESALEQGWLLAELQSSFGFGQEVLAQRFGRSQSWVSRRLALVSELPEAVQDEVRRGRIGAHAAMKHLVPMARQEDDCERLARDRTACTVDP
jgi:ParB/RepB/Spo0J family partition protein